MYNGRKTVSGVYQLRFICFHFSFRLVTSLLFLQLLWLVGCSFPWWMNMHWSLNAHLLALLSFATDLVVPMVKMLITLFVMNTFHSNSYVLFFYFVPFLQCFGRFLWNCISCSLVWIGTFFTSFWISFSIYFSSFYNAWKQLFYLTQKQETSFWLY